MSVTVTRTGRTRSSTALPRPCGASHPTSITGVADPLIWVGAWDGDFGAQARRGASEIPGPRFISVAQLDHLSARPRHDLVIPAVLRMLRGQSR
jgi:hypothetical protein